MATVAERLENWKRRLAERDALPVGSPEWEEADELAFWAEEIYLDAVGEAQE